MNDNVTLFGTENNIFALKNEKIRVHSVLTKLQIQRSSKIAALDDFFCVFDADNKVSILNDQNELQTVDLPFVVGEISFWFRNTVVVQHGGNSFAKIILNKPIGLKETGCHLSVNEFRIEVSEIKFELNIERKLGKFAFGARLRPEMRSSVTSTFTTTIINPENAQINSKKAAVPKRIGERLTNMLDQQFGSPLVKRVSNSPDFIAFPVFKGQDEKRGSFSPENRLLNISNTINHDQNKLFAQTAPLFNNKQNLKIEGELQKSVIMTHSPKPILHHKNAQINNNLVHTKSKFNVLRMMEDITPQLTFSENGCLNQNDERSQQPLEESNTFQDYFLKQQHTRIAEVCQPLSVTDVRFDRQQIDGKLESFSNVERACQLSADKNELQPSSRRGKSVFKRCDSNELPGQEKSAKSVAKMVSYTEKREDWLQQKAFVNQHQSNSSADSKQLDQTDNAKSKNEKVTKLFNCLSKVSLKHSFAILKWAELAKKTANLSSFSVSKILIQRSFADRIPSKIDQFTKKCRFLVSLNWTFDKKVTLALLSGFRNIQEKSRSFQVSDSLKLSRKCSAVQLIAKTVSKKSFLLLRECLFGLKNGRAEKPQSNTDSPKLDVTQLFKGQNSKIQPTDVFSLMLQVKAVSTKVEEFLAKKAVPPAPNKWLKSACSPDIKATRKTNQKENINRTVDRPLRSKALAPKFTTFVKQQNAELKDYLNRITVEPEKSKSSEKRP